MLSDLDNEPRLSTPNMELFSCKLAAQTDCPIGGKRHLTQSSKEVGMPNPKQFAIGNVIKIHLLDIKVTSATYQFVPREISYGCWWVVVGCDVSL